MAAAAPRAQDASSSIFCCTYHVFLSFRGEDTRKNFTSHLYGALGQANIYTFLDDDGIERGENIQVELQKAIEESKMSIIVFSRDYASSRWCLDELVMIMERKKTVGLIVLPVFYDVDPSQVRNQTESFGEAFARHEMRFKEEMDKVKKWRAALREVADLAGEVLGNRNEFQFIQDIVKKIRKKLYRPMLNVAPHLVGIDSLVIDISWWLQETSSGVATIFGIGGIGKTTIAKTVYNLNFERFQGKSFIANVRETLKEKNGLVCLQNQLLSDILNRNMNKVYSVDEGILKIKDIIRCRKVLIILDDVDQSDQLDKIIGMQEWLYSGSKIIITTRHARLLRAHEVCVKFEVKGLDDNESLQLFSWHAFGQGHPTKGYMEWSRKVVDRCGGLPLALKVLGSSLSGESIHVWESALQKLETILDSEIQEVLKISYDSLKDDHDKNLFLDIACFFIGEDKDYTIAILDGCDFYTTVGIQNLINRNLLTIDEGNKLMMHQLLKDMGREIIRQESTNDPGKRSRLCHHKDAFIVLKEKTGTKTIKGLSFALPRLMEDKHGKTIVSGNYAKRYRDEDYLEKSTPVNCSERCRLDFGFFSWQPMNAASKNSFSLSNEVVLETKTFIKMHKLKLLQLKFVKLRGDYEDFSKNLVWLCWHGFPLESIPSNFYLEKLVAVDMRHSNLKHVWKGTRFLAELKFLNLSHSHGLVRTPDFSGLPSLERLILEDCINLVEVDESVVNLDRLVVINLEDCKKLRKLPKNIWMLKSLEELILSGCSKLDELPTELGRMESLKVFRVDGVSINQLHAVTSDSDKPNLLSTTSWHSTLWSWFSTTRTPHSMSFSLAFLPQSLVSLSLAYCNLSNDTFPYGLAGFPSLRDLNLSGNPLHSVPESIKELTMLKTLTLKKCINLVEVGEFIGDLERLVSLNLTDCKNLRKVPWKTSMFQSLEELDVSGCSIMEEKLAGVRKTVRMQNLVEMEGLFKLGPINNSDISVIKSLGLSNVESFGSIEVSLLSNVSGTERKTTLQVLHECDISSIFLPGGKVPDCFFPKNKGSLISFDVPQPVGYKIRGLNLCTLYAFDSESDFEKVEDWPRYVKINNKTKRMRWTYEPIFFGAPDVEGEDMLWFSHWKFGDELEGGDLIDISVVLRGFEVKMCGICFVCEPEDQGIHSNTQETLLLGDFPWYNTRTCTHAGANVYFRCHHSFASVDRIRMMRATYENDSWDGETCIFCENLETSIF